MRRVLAGLALAACLGAPAAQAAVTYTFAGSMTLSLVNPEDPEGPFLETPVTMSFTLTRPGFITDGTFTPDSCTDDNAFFSCGDMEFNTFPNAFNVGGDFMSFGYSYNDGVANAFGGGGFYFFASGAFGAPGVYTTDGWPVNGPPVGQNEFDCCFGNAGFATLTVSGSPDVGGIPEPGTWALMILGFGGAGAMLRRRRHTVTCAAA